MVYLWGIFGCERRKVAQQASHQKKNIKKMTKHAGYTLVICLLSFSLILIRVMSFCPVCIHAVVLLQCSSDKRFLVKQHATLLRGARKGNKVRPVAVEQKQPLHETH